MYFNLGVHNMDLYEVTIYLIIGLGLILTRKSMASIITEKWVKGVWRKDISERYVKLIEYLYLFFGLIFVGIAILTLFHVI